MVARASANHRAICRRAPCIRHRRGAWCEHQGPAHGGKQDADTGHQVSPLRDWETCPVYGADYAIGTECEACHKRRLEELSQERRDLAEQEREAHRTGNAAEIARIECAIDANDQLVKNVYKETGTSPRASKDDDQMAVPFTYG